LTGLGDRGRAADVVPGRGDDEPHGDATPDGGGQAGGVGATGAEDEHVDVPDVMGAQAGEHAGFVGVAAEHDGDGPMPVPPQSGAERERLVVDRWRRPGGGDGGGDQDEREAEAAERERRDPPVTAQRPHRADDERDEDRDHDDGTGTEHRERRRRRGPGDAGDPREEEARGQVQRRRDAAAHDPCGEPGDDPPHHHRPGCRHRQEVRRQRRQRHPAEHRQEDRRHARLRGERDRQPRRHAPGLQARRHDGDAGARRHRQQEPHRPGEQRVDEHQGGRRQRQDPQRRRRATHRGRAHRQGRHGDGPDDRGLPPREDAERREHRAPDDEPTPQRQPPQQRRRHRQHERHVLPGNREEVGQPRRPEVVDLGRCLLSVVAQDEPREQRPPVGRQRRRAADERPPELVREAGDGPASVGVSGRRHEDGAPDVAPSQERAARTAHRTAATVDDDPLAREHRRKHGGGVARRSRRDPPTIPEPELGPQRAEPPLGIPHERRPLRADDPARRRITDAVPGAGPERRRQHGGGHEEDRRPGPQPRECDDHDDREPRHRPRRVRASHRAGRQHHHRAVVHRTRTFDRSSASLASPMPRTSSSSSTERKRPCSWR
jgi:hypothetical protein